MPGREKLNNGNSAFLRLTLCALLTVSSLTSLDGFAGGNAGSLAGAATSLPANPGTIFMIGLENHNFTQPSPTSSPEEIFTNPAAPYLNSLITPNSPNAKYVSYAKAYYNTGSGVHPSEPNYVWEEAGTDFGGHTDNDPGPGNFYNVWHFTRQMDAAGIAWDNFEEDVEYAHSPTNSAGPGTGNLNAYNGTGNYYYAVKHNPMAFFADSCVKNVHSLTNFAAALTDGTLGKYNWIMPDMYNSMHTALPGSFTYHGVNYTGDQSAIAQGDNFLSKIIPEIMNSAAFTNNGIIIIRSDETEGGDTTAYTIPEILISPLARGNAYASSVVMSHSSDLKTMEEIFGLNFTNSAGANYLSNAIPASETAATPAGAYNNVATVNDLGDLFKPAAPLLNIVPGSTNTLVVSWSSAAANFVLQQNTNLTETNWANLTNAVDSTNGLNQIVLPSLPGNSFFRLLFAP